MYVALLVGFVDVDLEGRQQRNTNLTIPQKSIYSIGLEKKNNWFVGIQYEEEQFGDEARMSGEPHRRRHRECDDRVSPVRHGSRVVVDSRDGRAGSVGVGADAVVDVVWVPVVVVAFAVVAFSSLPCCRHCW